MEAIDICEKFCKEVFHNTDISNIVVRIEKDSMGLLIDELFDMDYRPKTTVRESKTHYIINFEKTYPFEWIYS